MKTLKDLVSISPLFGAFLIFLGMLKLIIYYSFFGVHIVQYIQFSEILSSFLEDLNIIILLFIFMALHSVLGFKIIGNSNNEINYLRHLSKVTKSRFGLIYNPIMLIISIFFYIKYPSLIWVYITTILFFNFLMILYRTLFNRVKIHENWSIMYLLSSIIIVFTINLAIKDILAIRKNNQKIEIQLKDKFIKVNSNERLIGKTNGYLFVSNIENNNLRILNSSEVISIIIIP